MLIHEVTTKQKSQINEAWFSKETPQGKRQAQLEAFATKVQKFWDNFRDNYANGIRDPQEKQDYLSGQDGLMHNQLVNFVETNLLRGNSIGEFANGNKISVIIDQIVSGESHQMAEPVEQPPAPVAASKPAAEKPAAQTATSVERPIAAKNKDVTTSPRGTKLISDDPFTLRFRGNDYVLGDEGEWVNFKTNKRVPETQSRFLDKEEDYFHWIGRAQHEVTEDVNGYDQERQLFLDLVHQTVMATPSSDRARTSASRRSSASQRQAPRDADVESTGNDEADEVLRRAGFTVL